MSASESTSLVHFASSLLFGLRRNLRQQEALLSKLKEDNMVLFEEIRYNINRVLNAMNSKQMPPLSDRLNEMEKNSFLRWVNNGLCSQLRI